MAVDTSLIPGFWQLSLEERIEKIRQLTGTHVENLTTPIKPALADNLMENVIGVYGLPLMIVPNVRVNEKDYLVPLVTEEASNASGPSKIFQLVRDGGWVTSTYTRSLMTGQIQIINIPSLEGYHGKISSPPAGAIIHKSRELLDKINTLYAGSTVNKKGGGALKMTVEDCVYGRYEDFPRVERSIIVEVLFDVQDAFGAGYITRNMEDLGPELEKITGGQASTAILSNDAPERIVHTTMRIPIKNLERQKKGEEPARTGEEVADRIIQSYLFARKRENRALTYNKGIMNGIDALLMATGNDFRAQEAAAHRHASRSGSYFPLSQWSILGEDLVGDMKIPITVGVEGGITDSHPQARAALELLGNPSIKEFSELVAAMGLAQNAAALYSLTTLGIAAAHGRKHLYSMMQTAGIPSDFYHPVFERLSKKRKPSPHDARAIYEQLLKEK